MQTAFRKQASSTPPEFTRDISALTLADLVSLTAAEMDLILASPILPRDIQLAMATDMDSEDSLCRSPLIFCQNPGLVSEAQKLLFLSDEAFIDGDMLEYLAANPSITPETQDLILWTAYDSEFEGVRQILAANPVITGKVQLALSVDCGDEPDDDDEEEIMSGGSGIRAALAANQSITERVQLRLAEDECIKVRLALSSNPLVSDAARLSLERRLPSSHK